MRKNITIIGGGNLGRSIAEGLLKSGYAADKITVTRRKTILLDNLKEKGVRVTSDNVAAVTDSEFIILALKPYLVIDILTHIKPVLKKTHTIISVASGVSIEKMKNAIGMDIPVIRVMPNTAISVQESISCIAGSATTSQEQLQKVKTLFDLLGETVLIREDLMNAATVLGACGIAYALRFVRAMMQGGIEIGFDAKTAGIIAGQTVKGAAELLIQRENHPEREIDKVTTPKGCTIAGLNEMEHQGFSASLIKGITTSFGKIED